MDQNELELHAHHHKDRVDLNEQHANVWGKFQKRREEYTQKYGSAYADILLRQEKEALEAQFSRDHTELSEDHGQQWENYHEAQSPPEKEIKEIDEKNVQSIGDQSTRTLFSNPFKQMDNEQKPIPASETKDLGQSQEYMKAMISTPKANLAKEKEEEHDKKPVSISARFSQGLSYMRTAEQANRPREQNKDIDRG